jgi:hypothetical protein
MDKTERLARAMIVLALARHGDALVEADIDIGPLVETIIDYLFLRETRSAEIQ